MASEEPSSWQGRIPTDIDRPEPILFNLTARQCLIIAPVLLGAWGAYLLLRDVVPLWVFGLALAPILGTAIAVALGERDALTLDRFAVAALAWVRAAKHLVPAPSDAIPARPRWAPRLRRTPRLEPLRLPASAITSEGVIDLGGRCAAVITCTTLPFQLASGREQDQVLAAFAAVLDSLTEPVQILVQRRNADLSPFTMILRENAHHLPPTLGEAATAHAAFLDDLALTHDLSHHEVLVVVTAAGPAHRASAALRRRAQDIADRLTTLGVRTRLLDRAGAELALRQSLTTPGGHLTDPATDDVDDTANNDSEER
ncbi:PrgI family protein [Nocardiopsis sp. EMB25]|uniref:PrgI family protein n=1 Tax=Nocardiopsis sp. EMB25 TaxID=2835867 RepID=UPI0022847FF9|nr:PrgI family protein [Nocardiopsis sp. EMB25]MCY9787120.1 PrgI family protein [Nocardiopsis sp. EMB25]